MLINYPQIIYAYVILVFVGYFKFNRAQRKLSTNYKFLMQFPYSNNIYSKVLLLFPNNDYASILVLTDNIRSKHKMKKLAHSFVKAM